MKNTGLGIYFCALGGFAVVNNAYLEVTLRSLRLVYSSQVFL